MTPAALSRREDGSLVLPQDYYYCDECSALTPHKENKHYFFGEFECVVCGKLHGPHDVYTCPNCLHSTEDIEEWAGPLQNEVQVHADGCHFLEDAVGDDYECQADRVLYAFIGDLRRQMWGNPTKALDTLWKRTNAMLTEKCDCPKHTIITNPQITDFSIEAVYHPDCMHAHEWTYSVHCPICGCTFTSGSGDC